ncbi:MAG: hypothetical protein A2106_06085 [Planctomycetes bacterium GWF2_40_8]|nr:MAG: hypothetical protein A2106_06085 [Planctomycetes bacterium GWF2_40_8]
MDNINFHYDREADVMYFSLGMPKKAKTLELADDFILRLDLETRGIVGLTIIDFSKHFPLFKELPEDGYITPDEILKLVVAA